MSEVVPKEKEYRFRIRESERLLIVRALKDFQQGWIAIRRIMEGPSKLEIMKETGHMPSRETVNHVLEKTHYLILRLQRRTRGRPKGRRATKPWMR